MYFEKSCVVEDDQCTTLLFGSGRSEKWGTVTVAPFEQCKKNPGCLGYIGDYTIELCGDYNNKP